MSFSPLIDQLITALRCLPGVGPKSAQRMAFHILERDKEGGRQLSQILQDAIENVGRCEECRTLCETPLCRICDNPGRDRRSLCVVETPTDVLAIEQAGGFRGVYFVLLGHLSPIDGIGPAELGVDKFQARLKQGEIKEVIMATSTTVEGETTAYYLAELTKSEQIMTTRLAHGVPLGGELEHFDAGTLSRALAQRATIKTD